MYKFLNFDIQAATFFGVSKAYQRKLALAMTLTIWFGLAFFISNALETVNANSDLEGLLTIGALLCLVVGLGGGPFLPLVAARALFSITPMGVLYRNDQIVLDRAKDELFKIAKSVDFSDYLTYGKINPEIRSRKCLLVIAHQKNGDLELWAQRTRNLHQLANLVYQIFLVEERLHSDSLNRSYEPDL